MTKTNEVLIIVKKSTHKKLLQHKIDTDSKSFDEAINLLLEGKNE